VANYQTFWTSPASRSSTAYTSSITDIIHNQSLTFYWLDGSLPGVSKQVQVSGRMRDRPFGSKKTTFTVVRPEASVTATTGNISINDNFNPGSPGDTYLHYGTPAIQGGTPGIRFNLISIIKPSGFDGSTQWVQTNAVFREVKDGGGTHTWEGSGLDTFYPYGNTLIVEDSPGQRLDSAATEVTIDDHFSMYLMFKPSISNSIWVTLRKIDWAWQAKAINTGTIFTSWNLNSSSKMAPVNINTFDLPMWDVNNLPDFQP
jgi:hypothetical protein